MTTRLSPSACSAWYGLFAIAVATAGCTEGPGQDTLGAGFGSDNPATTGADTPGGPGGTDPSEDSTSGPGGDPTGPDGYSCDREQAWFQEFAEDHCGRCHGPGGSGKGGFDYVLNFTQLLTSGKIAPGDAEASPLFSRMASGAMPPQGELPRPTEEQIDRTAEMIDRCFSDGGPGTDDCLDQEHIGYEAQLALMLDDLTSLPAGDYPFIRYLTFTHLHNVGVCGSEFDGHRGALSKLVNSLSDQNKIVVPVAVDPERTIYRIDMRDYGWDQATGGFVDRWELAVASTPYAVVRLEDEAITLQQLTTTPTPFLMADAFVNVAAEPPLYPLMAGLPDDLTGLEAQLGLDIADDIADQSGVARAGILISGIATRNRVLQRHQISNGAFWRTFEFDDDTNPQQNILSSPLDFREEGGSIIFNLPNGLHGYMVINANGQRIDEAPTGLMLDPNSDGGRVKTGLSCFGCHQDIVQATDDVRDFVLDGVEFDATDKATVSALYPPAADFHTMQSDDTDDYRAAVADAAANPDAAEEPINKTHRDFIDAPITLEQAAAELGIAPNVLESQLVTLNPALESLRDGGTVKRGTWAGVFEETICTLNLGTPANGGC